MVLRIINTLIQMLNVCMVPEQFGPVQIVSMSFVWLFFPH